MSETTQLTEQQIDTAVNWWVNALRDPKFDNGEPMHGMLAMLSAQTRDEESVQKFGAVLREILKTDQGVVWHGLHVDYHPEGALAQAAQAVGIRGDVLDFPWKTNMWFQDGGVKVSAGYGATPKWVLEPTTADALE